MKRTQQLPTSFRMFLVLACTASPTVANLANASAPSSVYTVPSGVQMFPNDTAPTRVVIRGAFFLLQSTMQMTYSDPICGIMHFECKTGQEALCKMQWNELRAGIAATGGCLGFGQNNVIASAPIQNANVALGAPSPWDIGMGISPGGYVDGKCPKARALQCGASIDGGTSAPITDAGAGGVAGSTGGVAGSAGGVAGSTGGAAGGAPGSSTGTNTDRMNKSDTGGCSLVGTGGNGHLALFALFTVGWLAAFGRGKRRA